MPRAKTPSASAAASVVFRTYYLPESLREAVRKRRAALGVTVRDFLVLALDELPALVAVIERELPNPRGQSRPARLPLSEPLLVSLRAASNRVGVPASRLLQACLWRAANRKRRRRKV